MPMHSGPSNYDPAAERAADAAEDDELRARLLTMANDDGNLPIRREDLDRLYEGRDDERAALFAACQATAARKATEADRLEQHYALAEETQRVLREWDEQRKADAQAEARRRLTAADTIRS